MAIFHYLVMAGLFISAQSHAETSLAVLQPLKPANITKCASIKNSKEVVLPVVGNRLMMEAPKGSSDIPKSYSIMSAPEPVEHESRLILDIKRNGKFVIYVRELFQTAPDNFISEASSYLEKVTKTKPGGLEFGLIDTGDKDLMVVAGRPKKLDVSGSGTVLLAMVVRSKDGTLLSVQYLVDKKALTDKKGCQNYALSLAKRTRSGTRSLDLKGGKRTKTGFSAKFEITIPKSYVITKKEAEDFEVYFVQNVSPLGKYPGELVIYFGSHPDTETPSGEGEVIKQSGKLIGTTVEWNGWRSKKGGELVATLPLKPGRNTQIQVRRIAYLDGAFLDELGAIADSIVLK